MAEQYGCGHKALGGYGAHPGTVVECWEFPWLAPGAGLEGNGGVALLEACRYREAGPLETEIETKAKKCCNDELANKTYEGEPA